MNGDLLTRINFDDMLGYHMENGFDITMGAREYQYQIPYGVIDTQGNCITGLVEKPSVCCTINAGVYCLDPQIIEYLSGNEYFDITNLVDKCIQKGRKVGRYDINDYWIDIGQVEDYNRANLEYGYVFNKENTYNNKIKKSI
jgi:NDP-sugar pyrophosphorylase family protein